MSSRHQGIPWPTHCVISFAHFGAESHYWYINEPAANTHTRLPLLLSCSQLTNNYFIAQFFVTRLQPSSCAFYNAEFHSTAVIIVFTITHYFLVSIFLLSSKFPPQSDPEGKFTSDLFSLWYFPPNAFHCPLPFGQSQTLTFSGSANTLVKCHLRLREMKQQSDPNGYYIKNKTNQSNKETPK